ncbi:uncharacterized protein LOC120562244 isoform X1 [Perca fluviatilis]|uniref:uncharacterized protein LOC120562244 isoform X1 n=1 Tax=Perca fluviatilis TaxID=8168 RepID=UPI0019663016|nr:uncharacterized protein LOC120562244 isoform X1 [Perca fluviatilis]XP_039661795.1 uncharacterized protein LOC120562244 isoform X1 [Perca fluviatilis]
MKSPVHRCRDVERGHGQGRAGANCLQAEQRIPISKDVITSSSASAMWFIRDICGIVCAVITWLLLLYAEFVVLFVMLLPSKNLMYSIVNGTLFNILAFLALASHLRAMCTDPGAVPKGNATKEYIESLQLKPGQVVYKCPKCCSIKPDRAHHCRGEGAKGEAAFRESFSRLGELRSIAKEVLALTASADTKNRRRVTKLLHMENATKVTVSPNRTNIRLGLTQVPFNDFSCMDWVLKEVKDKALSMSPIIIYCKSLKSVGKVFSYIKAELGEDAWIERDQDHKAENLLIGMFHSKTLTHHKQRVLASFNGEGSCRVVATTALGMGLNFSLYMFMCI